MKNIKTIIWVLTVLFLASCGSDELSNKKAEKIISKCLENDPELIKRTRMVIIKTGAQKIPEKDLGKYQELEDKGFIELSKEQSKLKENDKNDPLWEWRYKAEQMRIKDAYNVKVTQKAESYIDKTYNRKNKNRVQSHAYELDKVLEVQEIPSQNKATVKVRFKPVDITPFSILYHKDPSEFWDKDVKMSKTSNGWKYCDDY